MTNCCPVAGGSLFFVALPLGFVGVYLRTRLADTPEFAALEREAEEREKAMKQPNEARRLLALWPYMLVCMGLVLVWNVTNYMLTSYMPTYVADTMPKLEGLTTDTSTTSQVVQIVVILVAMVTNWPAYYLIIAGVIGLVSLWFLQEPNGRRMWGSPPSAASRATRPCG